MSIKEEVAADAEVEEAQSDKKPLELMTKNELKEEAGNLRTLWNFLPNDLQYFLSQIGKECVFTDRMNKVHYGSYHGFECEIKSHNIYSQDLRYDNVTHKPYVEEGTVSVMASTVTNYKMLNTRIEHLEQT